MLWKDIAFERDVIYRSSPGCSDLQADGGIWSAVVEELKSEASIRGLELPEVIRPALRRQVLRVERMKQLRLADLSWSP